MILLELHKRILGIYLAGTTVVLGNVGSKRRKPVAAVKADS